VSNVRHSAGTKTGNVCDVATKPSLERVMHKQVTFALAHPVFDPMTQIVGGHHWVVEKRITAGLTVNIGME
jgi:hypothetical protein